METSEEREVRILIQNWEKATHKAEKEAAESALEAEQIAREKEDARFHG